MNPIRLLLLCAVLFSADVRAEATGGDVSCEFPFEGRMKDESLHGKINGGGNQIRLESSGGSIAIRSSASPIALTTSGLSGVARARTVKGWIAASNW